MMRDIIRSRLRSMKDDELLAFVRREVLPELNAYQLQQLQDLVNEQAGMTAWFAKIHGDNLQRVADKLDLSTIRKVLGVFTEAEHRRKLNPVSGWYNHG